MLTFDGLCFFVFFFVFFVFFQAEDGIRDLVRSRGLGDVYKRQDIISATENAIDRLEDVSDVVETVIVKNA